MRRIAIALCAASVTTSCALIGTTSDCGGTEIIGKFRQVGDLVPNANVQSADVVIGSVKAIELDHENWLANVTMCVEPTEKIPADVEAVVRTTSLLGEKFIDLKVQSPGGPYLKDGDIIGTDSTSKATELEDVFAQLSIVLGEGNLEDLNRFTSSQAKILRGNAGDLKTVLRELRTFTDLLSDRRHDIAASVDALDAAARDLLSDSGVLKEFLRSFAASSDVLADQKRGLQELFVSLDRFTKISLQLLNATEAGLNKQFDKLRPVLRTAVRNSGNIARTLKTACDLCGLVPGDDAGRLPAARRLPGAARALLAGNIVPAVGAERQREGDRPHIVAVGILQLPPTHPRAAAAGGG